MKEAYLICAERKNEPKCMDCTWFKTDPNDLPDFGKCVKNHWNVLSSELACADFAYHKGGKEIERSLFMKGKASDVCTKCKNCKGTTKESNGVHVWLTEVECEDPYDGMTKTLDADSDICCSMYEEKKEKEPCDKISLLEHELEMERLRTKIHQLEKEKAAHLKGIERLKKSQEKLQNQVKNLQATNEESYKREEKLEDKCHKLETDVTTLNSKIEIFKNKNDKYLKKIINQQITDYKQRSRILELECAVNKLQSGEYDDILAKDVEIKSLQAKYEDVMSGWNHTMESHDRLKDEIDKLKNENTSLNTINKGLAEDRKKLINYMRSLKIASDNYLKEFTYTYKED